jgi:hypothetical protein
MRARKEVVIFDDSYKLEAAETAAEAARSAGWQADLFTDAVKAADFATYSTLAIITASTRLRATKLLTPIVVTEIFRIPRAVLVDSYTDQLDLLRPDYNDVVIPRDDLPGVGLIVRDWLQSIE